MPRGFLVKRSRRPTPISYRTRCSCYPATGLEGGDLVQLLVPPPFPAPHFPSVASASESAKAALLPAPAVPQFGTLEGPSSPAPLHSPARAVSEERSFHLASLISAESFLAPEPLLLGPGDLKLWAPWAEPRRTEAVSGQKGQGSPQVALRGRDEYVTGAPTKAKPVPEATAKGGSNNSSSSEWDTPSPGSGGGGSSGEPEATGAKEFTCPHCVKRFRRQSALRKHLPLHHEPLDGLSQARPLPEACLEEAVPDGHSPLSLSRECHLCPVCGETFPSKSGQECHLRMLHAAQAFPCKYCPVTFYSSPGLTRHINKCHPLENRQVILLQVPVWV
ncbi:insulinoma-associated protein 1 [Crotalus adamanteus]|uniref:Insulinoma-associated protein 1 n=1 Tax=Crotalus adamanteus TaxID=8729 RepID=A0AAW1BCB7_CROAD